MRWRQSSARGRAGAGKTRTAASVGYRKIQKEPREAARRRDGVETDGNGRKRRRQAENGRKTARCRDGTERTDRGGEARGQKKKGSRREPAARQIQENRKDR